MEKNETHFYYNQIPLLINTTYDVYDGIEISYDKKNELLNLLENGFVSKRIMTVTETFRAIIFFITELDAKDEEEKHHNWFYNIDESIIKKVIETIEKYWKRSDWQYLGPEAIYFYYFDDLGTGIDKECYNDEYWIIDFNNNQAESKCGKYKIAFNQDDWNSFKKDEYECISNYIPISLGVMGIFYDDNEIKNKTADILKIISDINLCLQETTKKIKAI